VLSMNDALGWSDGMVGHCGGTLWWDIVVVGNCGGTWWDVVMGWSDGMVRGGREWGGRR
jgi:hypothetical protein